MSDVGEEGAEGEEGGGMDITDKTDSKVLGIRRTIYLTIMSRSDDFPITGISCKIKIYLIKIFYFLYAVWILKSVLTN